MPQENAKNHNLKAVPKLPSTIDEVNDGDASECPRCFGTGMEIVRGKGARVCTCRTQNRKLDKVAGVGFPPRYESCTFATYHPESGSQKKARHFAFALATQYPAVEQGLLLMGPAGVGKTHLAISALRVLSDQGFSCLFFEFGALLKNIRESYNPHTLSSELSILSPVLNVEILLLDELGASKPTDWVRDTLYHIINSRYNQKKLTIFTTNFLDDREDPKRDILEDRIGVSIRSRLHQMCRTIVVTGKDYRETFDQELPSRK